MTKPTPEQNVIALRYEIERTRAELGETVELLAARADVKARAQEAMDEVKGRARAKAADASKRAQDLVQQVRSDPRGSAERVLDRLGRSVRENPTGWMVGVGVLLAFLALVDRRRRLQ
jgi:ElaB/YqjD/DUF883 family membrane-anchored ribosome-binding protein